MKAYKVIAALLIAATFIALPIVSAEGSDAAKSWTDGEDAIFFKFAGVDDEVDISGIMDPDSVAVTCVPFGNVDLSSVKLISLSDFAVGGALATKTDYPFFEAKIYLNLSGNISFSAKMNESGLFITNVPSYYTGSMYDAINEYFGSLTKGQEVSFSGIVSIDEFIITSMEYQEVADCYVCKSTALTIKSNTDFDITITIGDKSVRYCETLNQEVTQTTTNKFSETLTSTSVKPSTCKMSVSTNCSIEMNEIFAEVNGLRYNTDINENAYDNVNSAMDFTDTETAFFITSTDVSPYLGVEQITGFKDEDDAKEYFETADCQYSDSYSSVKMKIDDAYAKPVSDELKDSDAEVYDENSETPWKHVNEVEDSSSGSGNDYTRVYIVVGVTVALIVAGIVIYSILGKRY